MAFKLAFLRSATANRGCDSVLRRWTHALASPFNSILECPIPKPQAVLPLDDYENENKRIEIDLPSFGSGGSMELMAVPKKKTSPYKRGLRNGPKALKPVPVIVRCKACGRVKLPHFYCCSGIRENPSERSN
uniref:Large ribosomal subunit protein bL32m n=1 Tax=Kalanchoe fedtschenkoi TaxID=63787 RepID=A0A7N0UV28_KALFE